MDGAASEMDQPSESSTKSVALIQSHQQACVNTRGGARTLTHGFRFKARAGDPAETSDADLFFEGSLGDAPLAVSLGSCGSSGSGGSGVGGVRAGATLSSVLPASTRVYRPKFNVEVQRK